MLPALSQALLFEHFPQAVLADMRGVAQPPELRFDPTEDSQDMSIFESGDGKEWFKRGLGESLISGIDKEYFQATACQLF